LKYLKGLVSAIGERGGTLFANSPVVKVDESSARISVTTEAGRHVHAARAIVATNSPINDQVTIHSKLAPCRTYAMAFTLPRGAIDDALYWDTADPYHYVRLNPGPGSVDYLIVGGADHKSGEADDGDVRFEAVEAWIRTSLPDLGKEVQRWSGQVLDTVDYSTFIGKNPGNENIFVVTGDSGQGMTHGALSGLLLKDLILSGSSPWAGVYDPGRKPAGAIANFVSENITAVKNLAESLAPGGLRTVEELEPGKGAIVGIGSKKIAAYRDPDGSLHQRSAPAPIWAAKSDGTRPRRAGIALATGRIFPSTAMCLTALPLRAWLRLKPSRLPSNVPSALPRVELARLYTVYHPCAHTKR
jgi:FAD dependent oxidoreductase